MNFFAQKTAAERYAKARPDFHAAAIQKVKAYLNLDDKLNKALDIACGTGLSSKALLDVAHEVHGTDASKDMLNQALEKGHIQYQVALAEKQPYLDESFELITVCSGVHWFDIPKFLTEANRLLKSKSYLVLYDNYFAAEMEQHEGFTNWHKTVYLSKFPPPARQDSYDWSGTQLTDRNFLLVKEDQFKNAVDFSKKQLVLYFTTQSNVIAAVEKQAATYEAVEAWLNKELTEFFESEQTTRRLYFHNWIKYLQRMD